MVNLISMVVLLLLVGSASFYIWKEKRRGSKCIGCPMSVNGSCPKHCGRRRKSKDRVS